MRDNFLFLWFGGVRAGGGFGARKMLDVGAGSRGKRCYVLEAWSS